MTVVFASAPIVNGQPALDGAAGVIALVAADLFVIAFAVSWGPVLWVLLGEMFPNRIRSAALGLASGVQWMANWTIAVTFPVLRHALGVAYGFYALCAVLSLRFRLAMGPGNQRGLPGRHARRGVPGQRVACRDLKPP